MNIEITDNSKENFNKKDFPPDSIYNGDKPEPGEFKIFIRKETLGIVDDYLSSDLNNELGGVLVGEVCLNPDLEMFIAIDNCIIAKHTNSSLSRLTFTHDTWDYINNKLESDFPDKKILGWFHSHPGHTVFLSNYDLFIQENFFDMEYMVAYVFDPTIKDRGFFYKSDGKIKKSGGYYTYDNSYSSGKYIQETGVSESQTEFTDKYKPDTDTLHEKIKNGSSGMHNNKILVISVLLNLLLTALIAFGYFNLKNKIMYLSESRNEIEDLKIENARVKEKLDNFIVEYELKKAGIFTDSSEEKNTAGFEGKNKYDSAEYKKNKTREIAGSNSDTAVQSESITYKVKPGDTIEKIANLFYKSREKAELIVIKNNLKNKADIKSGQMLQIPDPEK